MIITNFISNFDIFRILINDYSYYDIMYSDLFEKMRIKKDKMWPYEGSDIQAFNGPITALRST